MRKMQINETENKKECYVPDTELASVIKTMARGCYQQMVASNLIVILKYNEYNYGSTIINVLS